MNVTKEMKEKAAARLVAVWWLPQGLAGDYARCALEGALADVPEPGERAEGVQQKMGQAFYADVLKLEDRIAELESLLDDADQVCQDALGHQRAGYEAQLAELEAQLDKVRECAEEWCNGNQASAVMPRIAEAVLGEEALRRR